MSQEKKHCPLETCTLFIAFFFSTPPLLNSNKFVKGKPVINYYILHIVELKI